MGKEEITRLKSQLKSAQEKHTVAAKAHEAHDKTEKIRFLNERSHKKNEKDEKEQREAEKAAKTKAAKAGEGALKASAKSELKTKTETQRKLDETAKKKLTAVGTELEKAKLARDNAITDVKGVSGQIKNSRDEKTYMSHLHKYKKDVRREERRIADVKSVEKKKVKVEDEIAKDKAKFRKLKKAQEDAHAKAKENHKKLVEGRESRNCVKMCKLYRKATNTESSSTRGKSSKKEVCFGEQKAALPSSKPKMSLLGESADCTGMACKCTVYASYEGSDSQSAAMAP